MPCLECILLSFAWNCFTNTCDYLLKGLLLTLFDKYLWLSSEGVALRRSVERVCARRSLLFTSSVAPVSLWIMFHFVCLFVCLFVYLHPVVYHDARCFILSACLFVCLFIFAPVSMRRMVQFALVCWFVSLGPYLRLRDQVSFLRWDL